MILKGNQRAGGRQMALHLLNGEANEHVSVHEVSGFVAADVHGALNEAYALSKGTRCKQFMYSLSLSPPPDASVPIETFEDALSRIEKKLDLEGQPRVVVFHEKEGRRHAHCVWSRINEDMKAVNISHPKRKLQTIAKQLYLENKWDMPKGFIDKNQKNPLNFTRAEWEQAQRTEQNPKVIKEVLQECWQISDSRKAFESALQDKGYFLAKGDRRTIPVAVDLYGEVYPLPRSIGIKKAEMEKRLGRAENLPTVTEIKQIISGRLTKQFKVYSDELNLKHKQNLTPLLAQKATMTQEHRQTRAMQAATHKQRWQAEDQKRNTKVRKGFKGLWDKLTGAYNRTRTKNERETETCRLRDQREKETLISTQLNHRKELQTKLQTVRQKHTNDRADLLKNMNKHYQNIEKQSEIRKLYEQEKHRFGRDIKRDDGFEPEM